MRASEVNRSREMESQQDTSTGARQAAWILQKYRVSLAVAIIRSRPPGTSGREHAEALGYKLRSQDKSWKKKAEELQREVLSLRQESLINRLTSNTKSSSEAAGPDSSMDESQDLFGPGSVPLSSDLQPGLDSETPELLLQDPQPAALTPPPVPSSHQGAPGGRAVLPHVHFLQTLCALHRVQGNSGALESLWFCSDGDSGLVLADSVCQLVDSVVSACRDPPRLGPGDLVLQGCQAAARATDLFCSRRRPSADFTRRVEESLKELTRLLLHGHQDSQAAEKLMEYLITLGSCSMSKPFLIRHILSEISALADQLWQAFQDQDSSGLDRFPVDQYQNSCFLFRVLEKLLQGSGPCRVEVESDQSGFLSHLEQRVFVLSNEFPLFCIYMWRIGGLLTSSD